MKNHQSLSLLTVLQSWHNTHAYVPYHTVSQPEDNNKILKFYTILFV